MAAIRTATLAAATLTMGLTAGLFWAYAHSVLPGLQRTDDRTFVTAMQQINTAILNGWFFTTFVGALAMTALAAVLHVGPGGRAALPLIAAALVLYLLVLAITAAVNVPLNDQLHAAGHPDRDADLAATRAGFATRWIRWNVARAALSTAAFGCLVWASVLPARLAGGA